MKKHSTPIHGKLLALLLVLTLVCSLAVPFASAATLADMNPGDDPLLGTKFPVDATIQLVTDADGQDISLDIPVSSVTLSALQTAIANGSITLSLVRDDDKPYVNAALYPNAFAGGALSAWKTAANTAQFSTPVLSASEQDGVVTLHAAFTANNYFYSRNDPDYSVPHTNGGYYMDLCGYFDLTATLEGTVLGAAPVKIAPYASFNTMWEIYKELDVIAETGTQNGLYAEKFSMGQSTAGRDMPYLIIADSKASVDAWLALTELAETDPDAVLAQIRSGALDNIKAPVMYSNIHSNEVAATDGVLAFAKMLVTQDIISYKTLTGFTAAGEAELTAEMGAKGEKGSVAIPDLVAGQATYLGYLTPGNNGRSGKVDLDTYYDVQDRTISVKDDLLQDVFFILVPEENVDGRTYLTRHSSNGYDLNRDNSFQTTSETANMQQLIGTFDPLSFAEFHGRVSAFQCEPCDPPHEPNFEYDLLGQHLVSGGEALGITAVANNDSYNSYVIPQRDYLSYTGNGNETYWDDPWDDMSTSYTPQFAMLHGTVSYTVELPAYCDATAQAVQYGILGQAAYVAEEKLSYLEAQVTIYKRGVHNENSDAFDKVGQWFCDQNDVEGAEMAIFRPEYDGEGQNGNFYPECYIIPMDARNQTNLQAAADMLTWLTRNDVKVHLTTAAFSYNGVTYPAGTMVVSMYQAKRSVANGALYDGTLIQGWTQLYSEGITSFNETRGFDMVTVAEPAAYQTIAAVCGSAMDYDDAQAFVQTVSTSFTGVTGADVVISNASEDSTAAVNALLKNGKTVAMIASGAYEGDFLCTYEDYLTVADAYILTATGIYGAGTEAKLLESSPLVYVPGTPKTNSSGFVYASQIGSAAAWNYDQAAMQLMGFDTTSDVSKADAAAGASRLDSTAKTAIEAGLPYIGYTRAAVNSLALSGATYTGLSRAMDCLMPVTYPNKTLVNASYIVDGDDILYGYGLGYFSAIPDGAVALVTTDSTKTPSEGFIPTTTQAQQDAYDAFLNNAVQGFSYQENGMNVVLFANSLTNKVHQRDEYAYISNFLFASMLTAEDYEGAVKSGTSAVQTPAKDTASKTGLIISGSKSGGFSDVSSNAYYADAVEWAAENGITTGTGSGLFGPENACTRAQIVTFLWRAAGSPAPNSSASPFTDVTPADYCYEAVLWAVENGITNGLTATTFGPDAACTRAQCVTFLFRALNGAPAASSFTDVAADAFCAGAVGWAVEAGITSGTSAATFSPNAACTRAQIVCFLYRAYAA